MIYRPVPIAYPCPQCWDTGKVFLGNATTIEARCPKCKGWRKVNL